jgi:hypothetical protein
VEQILVGVTLLCLGGLAFGLVFRRARTVALLAGAVLIYLAGLIAWWLAMFLQLVRLNETLARFNIYRLDGALGLLVYFGPPLLPMVAFLVLSRRHPPRNGAAFAVHSPMRNQSSNDNAQPALQRDPDEWKTGDEPMTDAQRSYLETLSRETGEEFDDTLTKAEASKRIDDLRARSPRLSDENE